MPIPDGVGKAGPVGTIAPVTKSSGEQIAGCYLAVHERLAALATQLTDEQAATPVPATPGWTVHEVLAHLAAIPTDVLAGRLMGIPDDAHTAAQVAARQDRPLADLVQEWAANVHAMADGARAGLVPSNLAVDALTHEQDIRGALGLPPALSAGELRFCVDLYTGGCAGLLRADGLPALRLRGADTDLDRVAGDGEPAAAVAAPEFELFRALSGRRSRHQVRGYDWTGDAAPYVDRFNVFGVLPADPIAD